MRTFLRHVAVVVPLVLLAVLFALPAQAQFKINTFDTAVRDSMLNVSFNPTANTTDPKAYFNPSDDAAVKHEGSASLKSVWRIHTTESWGGNINVSKLNPVQTDSSYYGKIYRSMFGDSTYLSWGAGTHLSLWYNNEVRSTASNNGVQMRLHIYEAGEGSTYYQGDKSDYEDWYFQSATPLNDSTPGWHELLIPLVDEGKTNAPDDKGFCLTDWSGKNHNNKLDWDRIIGYTIEWTAPKVAGDTAHGTVYYDDLRLEGLGYKTGYEAWYRFNDYAKNTADFNSGWTNGGLGKFDLYEEKTDTLMGGPSNTGIDWAINAKESWGGGANKEYNLPAGTYLADLSSKSELQFYVKVVQPITQVGPGTNKISMRLGLYDYSNGTKEEWWTLPNVRLDSVGATLGWQLVRIPLEFVSTNDWGSLNSKHFCPNPNNQNVSDRVLAWDKIGGIKLEFSASMEPTYDPSLVFSGKMLLSAFIPAGYRETDHTAPASVTGVTATASTYSNIITWTDVPSEPGSTYNVWVSEKPFTSTDEPGVENVPIFNLPLGTQMQTHLLRSANTDQDVSLYYGVTASDKVGNTNAPAVIGPVTNKAQGVPTINLTVPTGFAADGDLTEWAGLKPVLLSVNPATPTAHAATNTAISGDADLKVNAYLAMDKDNLYVAFDVDDDVVSTGTTGDNWLWDSPDLFIGLYDWRGKHHSAYSHGSQPDYHLRFTVNQIWLDNGGVRLDSVGTNYAFVEKTLTSGYVIEARIPWTTFQKAGKTDSLFSPVEGMRIPIDFAVNDNDTKGTNNAREGVMCYSPLANDNSWSDVWRWTYTWIGNKMTTTGVAEQPAVANTFELKQNYPNPFNPSTIINYSIANAGPVTLKVFDVLGREVATLVNGEVQSAGRHQVTFNSSMLRNGVSTGVYFYRIESGSFRDVKKMMLLK